jgi:hypothetical protein
MLVLPTSALHRVFLWRASCPTLGLVQPLLHRAKGGIAFQCCCAVLDEFLLELGIALRE